MRALHTVLFVLAMAGCSSTPSSEPAPAARGSSRLSEDQLKAAGDALSAKLASYPAKEPLPRARVEIDRNALADEARRRLVESGKFAVGTDSSKSVDFVLRAKVTDVDVTLWLENAATGATVFSSVTGR